MTTWHLNDGPPRKFKAEDVSAAWGLPVHLAATVMHIYRNEARLAIVNLGAHVISIGGWGFVLTKPLPSTLRLEEQERNRLQDETEKSRYRREEKP